ncbi:MAG: hypothetical protein AAF548_02610 [Actinomycetota bacterium]
MSWRGQIAILVACAALVLASLATLRWVRDEVDDLGSFAPCTPSKGAIRTRATGAARSQVNSSAVQWIE